MKFQKLRIEKLCCILISKDVNIVERVNDLVKNDQESQLVVPFSFDEILNNNDPYFIRNRFKTHFYNRDLFAFESPLKKDLYFFGRNDLVLKLVNRHKANENTALFGLRKTGKTSVIFGVKRILNNLNEKCVFIDCQNPALHKRRWNQALWYVIKEIYNQLDSKIDIKDESFFTELNASILFEEYLLNIHAENQNKSIQLVFDEIENITFDTSPSIHWTSELDFIFFWQTLRTIFQKHTKLFSYFIVGTNPKSIETARIKGKDNPIFNQVYFEYIPNFDVPQTREMVRKLGRIMGLQFDEVIYSRLTEDFGGHPFLIRHVCSIINNLSSQDRPIRVDKPIYEKAKNVFKREYSHYIDMILGVLKEFYPAEFDMLKYLALDDERTFSDLADMSPEFTNHLLGYKIIDKNNNYYSFKIEAIKDYLLAKHRYEKALNNTDDRFKEISERRNTLEPKLRLIVRTVLSSIHGKAEASSLFLSILGEPRKSKYSGLSFNELFDPNKVEIYFEDLRKSFAKHYEKFKNIFGNNHEEFNSNMTIINKYRSDAHAKNITKEEMEIFRLAILSVETKVKEYLE